MVHRSQGRLNLGPKLWQQAGACVGMCSGIQVKGKDPTAYCHYLDHGKVSPKVGRLIGSFVLSQLHLCLSRMQKNRVNLSTTQPLYLPLVLSCPLHMRHYYPLLFPPPVCSGCFSFFSPFLLHRVLFKFGFNRRDCILCNVQAR